MEQMFTFQQDNDPKEKPGQQWNILDWNIFQDLIRLIIKDALITIWKTLTSLQRKAVMILASRCSVLAKKHNNGLGAVPTQKFISKIYQNPCII